MQGNALPWAFGGTLTVAVLHASTSSKADSKCGLQIENSRPSPVSTRIISGSSFIPEPVTASPAKLTGERAID